MVSIDIKLFEEHIFNPENSRTRFSVGLDLKDIKQRLEPLISDAPEISDEIVQDGIAYLETLGWELNTTQYGTIYLPSGIDPNTVQKSSYK